MLQQVQTVDENGQPVTKGTKVARGYYAGEWGCWHRFCLLMLQRILPLSTCIAALVLVWIVGLGSTGEASWYSSTHSPPFHSLFDNQLLCCYMLMLLQITVPQPPCRALAVMSVSVTRDSVQQIMCSLLTATSSVPEHSCRWGT